jgi:hypothetical protein
MTLVQVVQPAPDMCRFPESAFDRVIGTEVPLTFDGRPSGTCTVVAAVVIEGGYAVDLTLDLPEGAISSHVQLPSYTIEQNRNY